MVKNPPKGVARVGESKILIPQNFLNAIATEYGVSDSELKVLSLALEGVSTAAIAKQLGTRPEFSFPSITNIRIKAGKRAHLSKPNPLMRSKQKG